MQIFDNQLISTLTAMILIYALLSILVSLLVEWYNQYKKNRGKMLRKAIGQMLDDINNLDYSALFFNHHLVGGLTSQISKRPPQYISASMFADVVIDIIGQQSLEEEDIAYQHREDGSIEGFSAKFGNVDRPNDSRKYDPLDLFEASLNNKMKHSPFRDMLYSYLKKSKGDYGVLKSLLEKWYDDQMDRVSGWYKKEQTVRLRWAALVVTLCLNLDSVFIYRTLSMDEQLANDLVEIADGVADDYAALNEEQKRNNQELINLFSDNMSSRDSSLARYRLMKNDSLVKYLDENTKKTMEEAEEVVNLASELSIPFGWDENYAPLSWYFPPSDSIGRLEWPDKRKKYANVEIDSIQNYMGHRNYARSFQNIFLYILGLFISVLALSAGAPFWFEALVKVVNIRRAGIKPSATNTNPNSTRK